MASVVLVSPDGQHEQPVSTLLAFDRFVYGYQYHPQTGSIEANKETLRAGSPPPSPDPSELVRLGDLSDPESDPRKALGAALAAPATDLVLYVSPTGSDANHGRAPFAALATIDAALAISNAAGGGLIRLSGGTHPAPTTGMGSNTHIRGEGRGVTVIQRPAGQPQSCLRNLTAAGGDTNFSVSDLTVDGNQAATSGTPDPLSWYGLLFNGCSRIRISNVEAKNCIRNGIHLDGQALDGSRYFWLTNVESHHNQVRGIHIGNASRGVHYNGVTVYENVQDGIWLDHSESMSSAIYAYANGGNGIYIRNVFLTAFHGLKADRNGGHGILVEALTNSIAGGWSAHDNGRVTAGSHDIHFMSDPYFYGTSRQTIITGIQAGPATGATAYKAPYAGNVGSEDYAIYFEDGMTEDLRLDDVLATPGKLGDVRLPAAPHRVKVRDQIVPRVVADSLASGAIANTATETALATATIPASTTRPGDHYEITAAGTLDNIATSGAINLRLRVGGVGGTNVLQLQAGSQSTAQTGKAFTVDFDLVCRSVDTVGGTATWEASGTWRLDYTSPSQKLGVGTGARSFTADQDLFLGLAWATADPGNVAHIELATITKVN